MSREPLPSVVPLTGAEAPRTGAAPYAPPTLEVIGLACEISAYAPAGDDPLF